MGGFSGRAGTTVALDQALSTGHIRPAPHRASWRVVPVGQVIHWRDDNGRHEPLVVAYLRLAGGARFIAMNPKLSSPVTSKMMDQVLPWSPAVLITAPTHATNWVTAAAIITRAATRLARP